MIRFLKIFLIFVILYHIIVTTIVYGIGIYDNPIITVLIRESIWIVFILTMIISNTKRLKGYRTKWKYPWIGLLILLSFAIFISLGKGKNIYDILVGIKYGFSYLFIFLSTTIVGHIIASTQDGEDKIVRFIGWIARALFVIIVIGFVWQGAKLLLPGVFESIGYGKLGDFSFGDKPPIYYLTGPSGTLRWQGIFSGPNNYGYFLIAFLPMILFWWRGKKQKIKDIFGKYNLLNYIIIIIWILAVLMTLSRNALIGGLVVLAITNRSWISKHKYISAGILIVFLGGLIGLSVLKGGSTLEHISAKLGSLTTVINHPMGYGLGSSGPAIHHNGTILPENYFFQIMLDVGTIGFLIWAWIVIQISMISKKIKDISDKNKLTDNMLNILGSWKAMCVGWTALLVMGIFLHIFEDSMVNYWFFVIWGMFSGYIYQYVLDKNKKISV